MILVLLILLFTEPISCSNNLSSNFSKNESVVDEESTLLVETLYFCSSCDHVLFSSKDMIMSTLNWISFSKEKNSKSVYYIEDKEFEGFRYIVACRKCNVFIGHVFHDGPAPKYLRYTIRVSSLKS